MAPPAKLLSSERRLQRPSRACSRGVDLACPSGHVGWSTRLRALAVGVPSGARSIRGQSVFRLCVLLLEASAERGRLHGQGSCGRGWLEEGGLWLLVFGPSGSRGGNHRWYRTEVTSTSLVLSFRELHSGSPRGRSELGLSSSEGWLPTSLRRRRGRNARRRS